MRKKKIGQNYVRIAIDSQFSSFFMSKCVCSSVLLGSFCQQFNNCSLFPSFFHVFFSLSKISRIFFWKTEWSTTSPSRCREFFLEVALVTFGARCSVPGKCHLNFNGYWEKGKDKAIHSLLVNVCSKACVC